MKTQLKALIILIALCGQQYVIATEQGEAAELDNSFSTDE